MSDTFYVPEEKDDNAGSASETLSQLLARILDQLALSAWLPSGALTLLTWFVLELGTVVDRPQHIGPGKAISETLTELTHASFSGLLLVFGIVVVLTMVTQAFTFESIRVLEGYWGTWSPVEQLAGWRCRRHRSKRQELDGLHETLTDRAWATAETEINRVQQELIARGRPAPLTPNVIAAVRAPVLGERPTVTFTADEEAKASKVKWKRHADPELLRRRVSVQKCLRDYPRADRILPTKLGNVLRHHEDETRVEDIEGFVDRVYDALPFNLKLTHDEQRSRLDLYCSMVFVIGAVALVAVARFSAEHWRWAVAISLIAAVLGHFCYRAGIASARAYGATLVNIAHRAPTTPAAAPPT